MKTDMISATDHTIEKANGHHLPAEGVTTKLLKEMMPPLPVPRPTRLLVIGCGVKIHFPWGRACDAFENAVRAIRETLDAGQFTVVPAASPMEDPDEMIAFLDGALAEGVDGIVLFHAAYTAGEIGSELGRWLIDHPLPLLSWSIPESPTESGRLESNRLCCQNFLLNMLHRLGVKYAWLNAPEGSEAQELIARFARTARARARFLHGRVLHIGGSRVTAFYDGEVDELAVMRRFGLRFDRIDLQAAFDHARKFTDSDLRSLRDVIVNSTSCARNDVPDEQIFQTLRIGLAALDWAASKNYVGCVVKSWPELIDQYGCTTDGSVSMLNDFGHCTAEEGEMNGLLSSLAMNFLSEGESVSTMMDLSQLDLARNRIGIWHCGASPTGWLKKGTKYEARRHSILENAEGGNSVGLMMEFLLELGPATVLRYQSPAAHRAFSFEGELVETPLHFRGNYCEMQPTPPFTAGQIMNTIMSKGLDHHWSLGFGHCKHDLAMLHHWLGVEEISVVPDSVSSGLSLA